MAIKRVVVVSASKCTKSHLAAGLSQDSLGRSPIWTQGGEETSGKKGRGREEGDNY